MNRRSWSFWGVVLIEIAIAFAGTSLAADEADDELVDLVVTLLNDPDKEMRAAGLDQVRAEAKGPAATKRFASLLSKLGPDAQVGLLGALADRGDDAARADVFEILKTSDAEPVRLAAIDALGALGQLDDLPYLIKLLAADSDAEQSAAHKSLIRMNRGDVARAIATAMKQQPPAIRARLIEVLTARRALDTLPEISAEAVGEDKRVRMAAMTALAQLADRQRIRAVVLGVLKSQPGPEREAAEKCLTLACDRTPDGQDRAEAVIESMNDLPESDRLALLPALGRIGGTAALRIISAAASDSAPERHAIGLRALCNWPDASIAPQLIELATTEKQLPSRAMALAALIRVAPLPDQRSSGERLKLLQSVMAICTTPAERSQVLKRARAIRTLETLHFVLPYLDQPAYAQVACETVVELAHHRELREPNKAEFDRALDKVIQTSKDATVVDRANRYKRGQTWVRPAKGANS